MELRHRGGVHLKDDIDFGDLAKRKPGTVVPGGKTLPDVTGVVGERTDHFRFAIEEMVSHHSSRIA